MRPRIDEYFIRMAYLVATRSTCYRRQVGCVLVDQHSRVLATGYNGVAAGQPHCNEMSKDGEYPHLCAGATSPSGTNLTGCMAIHAEANALISCRNPEDIETCYVTASPCVFCIRFLLNTPCKAVVFAESYPHPESRGEWERSGRVWKRVLVAQK